MLKTFLKFLEYEKRYSKHTLAAYREDLNQLTTYLEATYEISDVSKVSHTQLRGWIVELIEKGISPRSVNRKIAASKSYFKFLQAREYISKNPTSRLKPLKTEKKLPSFVQQNDIIQLLDHVDFGADFKGFRDRLVLEFLYGTGIRLSELIHLKESDIDFHNSSIKVLGKRNKERVIPMGHFIVKLIREYKELMIPLIDEGDDVLLRTDSGQKMYPMFVYRLVKRYLGIVTSMDKRSPHVLRHTFATHLLDKGADLNAVKELLGHTSLAATQVYTHNSLEKLKSTFDQAHPKA